METFRVNKVEWLQKYVDPGDEVIDFGCGLMPHTRYLKCKRLIAIDGWEPSVDRLGDELSDRENIFLCFFEITESSLSAINSKSTDVCMAIDVVEHFEKEKSLSLIKHMERIAKKRVVIFTPRGFRVQDHLAPNDYQKHLCGFDPEEFVDLGYLAINRTGGEGNSFLAVKEIKGQ